MKFLKIIPQASVINGLSRRMLHKRSYINVGSYRFPLFCLKFKSQRNSRVKRIVISNGSNQMFIVIAGCCSFDF